MSSAARAIDRRSLLVGSMATLVGSVFPGPGHADERSVVDAARRRVVLPARVDRVFPAGPPASILVYAVAPERLVGWSRALGTQERLYLPPAYGGLPEVGRLTGRGNTANVEAVLAAK